MMKIKIKENAAAIYCQQWQGEYWGGNRAWSKYLRLIEGMELEVSTRYLFAGQFNTVGFSPDMVEQLMSKLDHCWDNELKKIRSCLENGTRIMGSCVESVIDDQRIGKARCSYCGKTVELTAVIGHTCPSCNESGYILPFVYKKGQNVFCYRNKIPAHLNPLLGQD